jgi:integration host factor subunit beta|tara:strand:- start:927 stop:1217 length:291 start_codon:yes stop_codon:yes gene_type:complete
LSSNKSDLINIFSNNYPNFLKKDLKKIIDIFISETKSSLRRHERVELRDVFSLETKLRKSRFARNPKTNERVFVNQKYSIIFKSSKMWKKKVNEKI